MMIKIIVIIATRMLMGGSGLENLEQTEDSMKQAVCTFRWGYLGDEDVCSDVQAGETNGMFIYLVCVVYGWLLLQKGNELANYYSGTNFSADSSFKATRSAAAMVQDGVHRAGRGAAAVVKSVKAHNDRKAARTYEKDQRAREAAANGGPAYHQTAAEKKKLDKAKKRLQKRGALTEDGKENGRVMASLLKNGKARTAMHNLERIRNATVGRLADKSNNKFIKNTFGRKQNHFENMASSYQERSESDLQTLKSVGRNSHKSDNSKSMANTASKNMAKRQYDNTPQGQNQKAYDQLMVDNLNKSAAYREKCNQDVGFASSAAGRQMSKDLAKERLTLRDMKQQFGCDDKILDPKFNPNPQSSVNFENLSSFK